ncbi:hypothetical protein ANO14919_096720 [Xylariales sp. No.14919]|nr:hypothetical protein ANO14919_096720 [Xylariales sp. No.14919]
MHHESTSSLAESLVKPSPDERISGPSPIVNQQIASQTHHVFKEHPGCTPKGQASKDSVKPSRFSLITTAIVMSKERKLTLDFNL